jgi:5-methylcytosine-specific restriction endonuclease McrA
MQRVCPTCKEIKVIEYKKDFIRKAPWPRLRTLIFKRDNFSCKICKTDKNLCIHHWDKNRENNKPTNLITFCSSCHNSLHSIYRKIKI